MSWECLACPLVSFSATTLAIPASYGEIGV